MNIHELLKVFLNESNNKELMLHACMLTGNREDALDLLSDLLIEIYENPMVQKALDPMAYYKAILRNKAYNIRKRISARFPLHQANCLKLRRSCLSKPSSIMKMNALDVIGKTGCCSSTHRS